MGVIAYKDGVMSADTGMMAGDVNFGDKKKIFTIDGSLVGVLGDLDHVTGFIHAMRSGHQIDFQNSFEVAALIVDIETGRTFMSSGAALSEVEGDHFAIGTGAPYALAAMEAGAPPGRAVEIAVKMDPNSSGDVYSDYVPGASDEGGEEESEGLYGPYPYGRHVGDGRNPYVRDTGH